MSYLLDKKIKRNSYTRYAFLVAVVLILIYFRSGVFGGFSYISQIIFRPVLVVGNNIGEKFSHIGAYFYSKKSLLAENENLKSNLSEDQAKMANYNTLADENEKTKEILGRKKEGQNLVLAAILAKPNQSAYDTLLIDAGAEKGLQAGQRVFALGSVPIGRVDLVYSSTAKIVLFSNPGEKTEVVLSGRDIFMQVVGRGGGNFEMILPRDILVEKGQEVVLPGMASYVVGNVETVVSDPRDSFQKALLSSPVNIQELKYVEIDEQR